MTDSVDVNAMTDAERRVYSDALVMENLGLAYALARRYLMAGVDIEDLKQEALVGLIQGARSFDPDRGSFSSWGHMHVKRALLRCIDRLKDSIVLPEAVGLLRMRAQRLSSQILAETGVAATEDELADRLEVTVAMIHVAMGAPTSHMVLSGWNAQGEMGDRASLLERTEDVTAEQDMSEIVDKEARDQELAVLDALLPDERLVLELRYGLRGSEAMRINDVVARTGFTYHSVLVLESRAICKLRHPSLEMLSPL